MTDSKQDSKSDSTNTSSSSATQDVIAKPDSRASSVEQTRPATYLEKDAKSGSGRGIAWFAVLVSLLAIAGSAVSWYQNQVSDVRNESSLALGVSEIGGQVSRLGDSISRIQQDQAQVVTQADLDTRVLRLQNQLDSNIARLAIQQTALEDSLNKINTDLQKGVNQYLVDEVSQLLRLANNSVLFGDDIQSAINALQLADEQLKSLSDPRYIKVRSQINTELAELKSVQQVDIAAVSSALDGLIKLIPDLPLVNEPQASAVKVAAAPVAAPISWRTELKKLWQDILGSVQIQRVDQPPKPLLAPEQRYFLDKNIQLSLASANLALMQGNQQLYSQSLTTAADWLNDYYDLSDSRVAASSKQFKSLMEQVVVISVPDITGSYKALQDIGGGK